MRSFLDWPTAKLSLRFRSRMISSFGMRDRKDYPEIAPSNMFIGKFCVWRFSKGPDSSAGCTRSASKILRIWPGARARSGKISPQRRAATTGFASYAANLLVSAVTGYDGCNDGKKEVYFSDYYAPFDAEPKLPLADGSSVAVTVKGGKRTVSSGGYRIAYREGGL